MESTLLTMHPMPSKNFKDASGMSWRVWNTVPIPPDWDSLPANRLVDLLHRSNEVPRRTGPMRRVPRPESEAESSGRG